METNEKIIEHKFFLSEIIGRKVLWNDKKIGSLKDLVIIDSKSIPEVSHFVVTRPFGHKQLIIPMENIAKINAAIVINIDNITDYETDIEPSQVLLKDYILDKKVIDLDDNDVEVVYDIKLALRNQKLYVTDVDSSKNGLLRRIGLKWLADFIYKLAAKIKTETIPWTYVQPLPEQIGSFQGNVKLNVLKDNLQDLHPVDLADIIEELDHDQRLAVFNELDPELASDTLEEIEPRVQRDLISSLDKNLVVELINDMTPAQAADVLAILPSHDVDSILESISKLDSENAKKIEFIIEKHDEKIINFATSHYFKFLPQTIVKDAIETVHKEAKDKDVIMYLYVVDESNHLLGVVDLRELLQAEKEETLEAIMTTNVISLNTRNTLTEASKSFTRYLFRAIPITDKNERLLGVIPYRDIMILNHRFI